METVASMASAQLVRMRLGMQRAMEMAFAVQKQRRQMEYVELACQCLCVFRAMDAVAWLRKEKASLRQS
jgi:hypothetical protein